MRAWTAEARKSQSEAIRRWQPWKNSTGPKTAAGKSRCRLNARKHGFYTANMHELRKFLRRQARYLVAIRLSDRAAKYKKSAEQTIINRLLAVEGQAITIGLQRCFHQFKRENPDPDDPIFPALYVV